MSQRLQQLVGGLKDSRLRITRARMSILRSLLKSHGPFTAEEIHKLTTKKVCDLATIYRTLLSLEKAGLIRRCEFGDGTARYELLEKENHHNNLVICRKCRKIEVLGDCERAEIDAFAAKRGFTDITHSLEFFGLCVECSGDSTKNAKTVGAK